MNQISLSGNVVTASKLITTAKGIKLTKFRLANNRCIKRGIDGGEDKTETVFIGCTYWNRHVDLSVGDRILVNGILRQDEFVDDTVSSDTLPRSIYFINVEELLNLEKRPKTEKAETSKYTITEEI